MPSELDLWSEIVSVLASWQKLHDDLNTMYAALGQIGNAMNLIAAEVNEHEQRIQRLATVITQKDPKERPDA